jgi:hypothetical protein
MGLCPEGLQAVQRVATEVGVDRRGASGELDGGLDSRAHRTGMVKAGMRPNIPAHSRNRPHPKRGRTRWCNAAIHALRRRVERTWAWEDTGKRWLLRFARLQQRH